MSATRTEPRNPRGRIRIESGAKRVRAYLGGEAVADTTSPVLVWEVPYYPTYYFPLADVRPELLEPWGEIIDHPALGLVELRWYDTTARCPPSNSRTAEDVRAGAAPDVVLRTPVDERRRALARALHRLGRALKRGMLDAIARGRRPSLNRSGSRRSGRPCR